MSAVVFQQVSKMYGPLYAVQDLSLEIARGELVAMLGPSGCGKTTTLRMLGGFVDPTAGSILLQGQDVTRVPPYRRDTAMVFQSYALFPHLNVRQNVGYGLRRRGVEKAQIARRVDEVLDMVRIRELGERYPKALSGGQQQRVAVARALVLKPAVLLLDEPFSALDAQVRESTRVEMRRIQQETGITAMLVTHDQQEAMSVADRIVVMNKGRIEQVGTPIEIYDRPATRFVADFIGAANILPGRVEGSGPDGARFVTDDGIRIRATGRADIVTGAGLAVLRAEDIQVGPRGAEPPAENGCFADVIVTSFLGTSALLVLRLPSGAEMTLRGDRGLIAQYPAGSAVLLTWSPEQVRILRA